jgi:hypothetical protein
MWTNDALETIMDVVRRGTHSLKKANKTWNIPLNSLFNHLNGKTKFEMGLGGVFTIEEDVEMIEWTLTMQECRLSINVHQLKMKVTKLTQTRPTSF